MKTTLIAILALVAGTLPAAAEEWAKTYTLSGAPDLRIETSDANIHVDTAEQKTIDVKVTSTMLKIGSGGLQIVEHQAGNTVEIEVRYPHHGITFTHGNGRVDVEVRMPHEGKVNLHTGDGRIDISRLKVKSSFGAAMDRKLLSPSMEGCARPPVTGTSRPMADSMCWNSKPVTATSTYAPTPVLPWGRNGEWRLEMAALAWRYQEAWRPIWICTRVTAISI